jgi:hypothetical protein
VKGQSETTVGIFAVLAVLVTVAVAGALIAGNRRSSYPPLEVVVDMPPPAAGPAPGPAPESVAARTLGPVPELHPEPEGAGGAPRAPTERAAEDVQEIDTAAGNSGVDEATPPNPIPENDDIATGDREAATPPVVVSDRAPNEMTDSNKTTDSNETTESKETPGTDVEAAAATSNFFDAPVTLFDAVVIVRRSNLRSEPGPDSEVLAKLDPGERVFRLDDKPVQGYYRVSSQGVVGWIWWLNVRDGPGGKIDG